MKIKRFNENIGGRDGNIDIPFNPKGVGVNTKVNTFFEVIDNTPHLIVRVYFDEYDNFKVYKMKLDEY